MRASLGSTLFLTSVLLCGCGDDSPAEAGSGTEGGGTAGGETASGGGGAPTTARLAWGDMSQEQRQQFMQDEVVPAMRPIFQEVDAARFANFGCRTCHGPNAQDVHFHMPNGVAPLDPAQLGALFQSQEPMAVAMRERVWPRMAELLGEPRFNPETGQGFSCFNCHARGPATAATPAP